MVNLAGFHLLATPAAIVLDLGMLGFIVPLSLSLVMIAYIWIRSVTSSRRDHLFVSFHWQLAARRTKILLIGYAVSGLTIGLALLATAGSSKGEIMVVALSRVAILPTLVVVMVCFVLESGSIYQAGRGEGQADEHPT